MPNKNSTTKAQPSTTVTAPTAQPAVVAQPALRKQLIAAGVTTLQQVAAQQQTITPAQLSAGVWVNTTTWQVVAPNTPGSVHTGFTMFSKTNCQGNANISGSKFAKLAGGDRGLLTPVHPSLQQWFCGTHRYLFSNWLVGWQQYQKLLAQQATAAQPNTTA